MTRLSPAVGRMMGRHSLDHPGLLFVNAGKTLRELRDPGLAGEEED